MSDTPRTDAEFADYIVNNHVSEDTYRRMADFARHLERELALEQQRTAMWREQAGEMEDELAKALPALPVAPTTDKKE